MSRNDRVCRQLVFLDRLRPYSSDELFIQFIDNLAELAWIKDIDGRYVYLNNRASRLETFCTVWYGKTDEQLWPEETARQFRQNDETVISTKRPLRTIERFRDAGQEIHAVVNKFPLMDRRGRVVFVCGMCTDVSDMQGEQESLRQNSDSIKIAHQRLEQLSRHWLTAQENERRHIARELHDEIGQALTLLKINLLELRHTGSIEELNTLLNDCVMIIDQALEQVRNISLDLRPPALDDLGLLPALRSLLKRQAIRAGLKVYFKAGEIQEIPKEVATACFRVVQEALTNVLRHARAESVWVRILQKSDSIHLLIRDDGVGFDLHTVRKQRIAGMHFGLSGMEERVLILGGTFVITSSVQQGTSICVSLPIPNRSDEDS